MSSCCSVLSMGPSWYEVSHFGTYCSASGRAIAVLSPLVGLLLRSELLCQQGTVSGFPFNSGLLALLS